MKKWFFDIGSLLLAEAILAHYYFFLIIGLVFNDTGFQAKSFFQFFPFLLLLLILALLFLGVYLLLKKIGCHRFVLRYIYLPFKLLIFFGFLFLYMDVYLAPSMNNPLNPYTAYLEHEIEQERNQSIKEQEKQYAIYLKNRKAYTTLHTFHADDGKFSLLSSQNETALAWVYESDDGNFFSSIPLLDRNAVPSSPDERYQIVHSSIGAIHLVVQDGEAFISIPSKSQFYPIAAEENVIKSNTTVPLRMLVRKNLINHLQSYTLTMKESVISRSGELGDDSTWVFKNNGTTILERNAANETTFAPASFPSLFSEMGPYSVHIEMFIDGEYRQVSNKLEWTKKTN